jgi:hypothetical protein
MKVNLTMKVKESREKTAVKADTLSSKPKEFSEPVPSKEAPGKSNSYIVLFSAALGVIAGGVLIYKIKGKN